MSGCWRCSGRLFRALARQWQDSGRREVWSSIAHKTECPCQRWVMHGRRQWVPEGRTRDSETLLSITRYSEARYWLKTLRNETVHKLHKPHVYTSAVYAEQKGPCLSATEFRGSQVGTQVLACELNAGTQLKYIFHIRLPKNKWMSTPRPQNVCLRHDNRLNGLVELWQVSLKSLH